MVEAKMRYRVLWKEDVISSDILSLSVKNDDNDDDRFPKIQFPFLKP